MPHVVIIGGGFAGLRAAKDLRKAQARVTLIDRSNHHLFQPLLYQVATAGLSPANIASPIRHVLGTQKNTEVLMAHVRDIDLDKKEVIVRERQKTEEHRVPFDYLIVATGARHGYFGHDDWAKNAPGLKSIVDATNLRRKILLAFESAELEDDLEVRKALLTFVLIGAGPTGVEMAGAISELAHKALAEDFRRIDPTHARVILVEALPRILPQFPDILASKAQKKLEKLGVEVRLEKPVDCVDEEGVTIQGERVHSKTVIWTAGVVASKAGEWLKAETDRAGRVKVNGFLTLPNRDDVFVIGDTACVVQDGKPLPGVAPVAMQQGCYVAKALLHRLGGQPWTEPFKYRDKGSLATVGHHYAIARIEGLNMRGYIAWWVWLIVHIYYLIGFRNRLMVLFQWAWAYMTFQRGARLITLEGDASHPGS